MPDTVRTGRYPVLADYVLAPPIEALRVLLSNNSPCIGSLSLSLVDPTQCGSSVTASLRARKQGVCYRWSMPRRRGKSNFPGNGVPTPGGAAPGGPREHSANVPPAHSLADFSPSDVSTHLMSLLGVNGDEHRQPNQSAFIRGVFTPESAAEESMRRQGEVARRLRPSAALYQVTFPGTAG